MALSKPIADGTFDELLVEIGELAPQVKQYCAEQLTEKHFPAPDRTLAKEYGKIRSEMRSVGEGLAVAAEMYQGTFTQSAAVLYSHYKIPAVRQFKAEFCAVLTRLRNKLRDFMTISPSSWRLMSKETESLVQRLNREGADWVERQIGHHDPVKVGKSSAKNGFFAGLPIVGYIIRFLGSYEAFGAFVARAATFFGVGSLSIEVGLWLIGAGLVGGLVGLIGYGLIKWVNERAGLYDEIKQAKKKLDEIKKQPVPAIEEAVKLRIWFETHFDKVVQISDAKCSFCDCMMISCEAQPGTNGTPLTKFSAHTPGDHQPNCHTTTFACGHRGCRGCSENPLQCFRCQAPLLVPAPANEDNLAAPNP